MLKTENEKKGGQPYLALRTNLIQGEINKLQYTYTEGTGGRTGLEDGAV